MRCPTRIEQGCKMVWDVYENVPSGYAVIRLHDSDDESRYEPHDGARWVSEYRSWAYALEHKNTMEEENEANS